MTRETPTRKRRLVIAAAAAAALIAVAAYLFTVPVNLTPYMGRIEELVRREAGAGLGVGNVTVKVLPSPEVRLTDVRFYDERGTFIESPFIRLELSLLHLFGLDILVTRAEVETPRARVIRYESGEVNAARLLAWAKRKALEQRTSKVRALNIRSGVISFADESVGGREIVIEPVSVDFSATREGKIEIQGSGGSPGAVEARIEGSGQKFTGRVRLEGSGSVKGLSLADAAPYLRARDRGAALLGRASFDFTFIWDRTKELTGRLDYAGVDLRYPSVFPEDIISKEGFATVGLSLDDRGGELAVEDVRLGLRGFDLEGSVRLGLSAGGRPETLEIAASTSEVPLKRLKELVPVKRLGAKGAKMVSGLRPLAGSVRVDGFVLSAPIRTLGTSEVLRRPGALGFDLTLDNLRFMYPGLGEAVSGLKGKVALKDGVLKATGISGNYGSGVIRSLDAEVTDLGGEHRFTAGAKAFIEVEKTLEIMKRQLKERTGAAPERIEALEASGLADLDLLIKGRLRGFRIDEYSGTALLKNTRITHPEFPAPVDTINGTVEFDRERIVLKDLSITEPDSELTLSGRISGYARAPVLDLSLAGAFASPALLKATGFTELEGLEFADRLPVSASIKGGPGALSVSGEVDLTPSRVRYRSHFDKAKGFPMKAEGDFSWKGGAGGGPGTFTIKRLEVGFGSSRAALTGEFMTEGAGYHTEFEATDVSVSDIEGVTPYITEGYRASGRIDLSFRTGTSGGRRLLEGGLRVKEGSFSSSEIASPVRRMDAVAYIGKEGAGVIIENLNVGRTSVKGRLEVPDFEKGEMRFELDSPGFFIEDFLKGDGEPEPASGKETRLPEPVTRALKTYTGSGRIRIGEGRFFGHRFSDLSVDVSLERDAIRFDPIQLKKNGGPFRATLTYYRSPDSPLLFESEGEFSGVDLNDLLGDFGVTDRVLAGELSGSGELWLNRRATPVSAGLNGSATLRSEKGRMWKFLIINKIFSIVNIISIDEFFKKGMPYKYLGGDFTIRDGIIQTDNFVFDSDSIRMSAVGQIMIPERYIEGVLAQHPLVTIDKFVTSLPLAGWIIGGEEKSTVKMYYEIFGPLGNPFVEPVPLKGIQEGILGVLQRLIETPFEMLKSGTGTDGGAGGR